MKSLDTLKYHIALYILLTLFITAECFAEQQWHSIAEKSDIKFYASYDGSQFEGQFTRFNSRFSFDNDNLTNSVLTSTIDVTSVTTQSRDRDQALAEKDWFYFSKFPQATFTSQSITQAEDNTLVVTGLLSIRDQQKKITFPMQWTTVDSIYRQATAKVSLDRRDYNIGIGEWFEDDTIGFDVKVMFSIIYQLKDE